MPEPVFVARRVEFSDTDMAGIVHFAAYFRYMEAAEHEFLRRLGLSVVMHAGPDPISWPRVAAGCDYSQPARFGDELTVEVSIEKLGEKSVKYRFVVRRAEQQLAIGTMTSVCCRMMPDHPPQSISIPENIRTLLQGTMAE